MESKCYLPVLHQYVIELNECMIIKLLIIVSIYVLIINANKNYQIIYCSY